MSLHQKTFVAKSSIHDIEQAFATLDNAFDSFTATQHWSQARDSFQSITVVDDQIIVARTFVYTDEAVATSLPSQRTSRPPV